MKTINFEQVLSLYNDEHKKPSFWQIYISNPLSIIPTYIIAKYTNIKPNTITFFGFFLFLLSLYFYFIKYTFLAILLFQLSFIMDIVDGNIARLKNLGSKLGAYIDIMFDWLKPGILYLFTWYITDNILLLFLIIINYMAAADWRVRESLLASNKKQTSKININTKQKKPFIFMIQKKILSKINSIEVEMIIATFYLYFLNDIFLYMALIIRLKDLILTVTKSVILLRDND